MKKILDIHVDLRFADLLYDNNECGYEVLYVLLFIFHASRNFVSFKREISGFLSVEWYFLQHLWADYDANLQHFKIMIAKGRVIKYILVSSMPSL
jgi:hypothetical protein